MSKLSVEFFRDEDNDNGTARFCLAVHDNNTYCAVDLSAKKAHALAVDILGELKALYMSRREKPDAPET